MRVKVQRMFPNCQKYKKCCSENWKKELENIKDIPTPIIIEKHDTENVKEYNKTNKREEDFESGI